MFSISILYSIAFSSWLLQTKDINFTMERKWSEKEITVVHRERKITVKITQLLLRQITLEFFNTL